MTLIKSIIKQYNLNDIKLMKIDIEGGEYDFLLKNERLIRKVKYYYIELHPTRDYPNPLDLKDYFVLNGYKVFTYKLPNGCYDMICNRINN